MKFNNGIENLYNQDSPNEDDFVLLNENWAVLQVAVMQALTLPITKNDFEKTYGKYDKKTEVDQSIDTLKNLQKIMEEFGSALTLNKEQETLKPDEEPKHLYCRIVYLSYDIIAKSKLFSYTYGSFKNIAKIPEKEDRLDALKEILMGPSGLNEQAEKMKDRTNQLIQDLSEFITKFSAVQEDVEMYASPKAKVYISANDHVKQLNLDIEEKSIQLASTQAKYTAAAIGAGTGAFACSFIPPPGAGVLLGLGLGLGVGLGVAEKLRKEKNKLSDEIDKLGTESQQASKLVTDLNLLQSSFGNIGGDMQKVSDNLTSIKSTWKEQQDMFKQIADKTKPEELVDMSAFMMFNGVDIAQEMWKEVSTNVSIFTKNAVIINTVPKVA